MMESPVTSVTIPMHLPSRANYRGHTRAKKHTRLVREQRAVTRIVLSAKERCCPSLPCVIRLTRISPRELDREDNLPMSLKSVRDGVCDWLGVDDRTRDIEWRYEQKKPTLPRVHQLRIDIYEGSSSP